MVKIKKLMEVEVDGPELFKELRSKFDIETRNPNGLQRGDLVDCSRVFMWEKKGNTDYLGPSAGVVLDVDNDGTANIGYIDSEGDDEENYFYMDGMILLDKYE